MASTVETYTIEAEQITVDLLVWRRFHRPMPGLVERVFDLNPGLARLPPFLPLGTVVNIPVDAPAARPQLRKVVRLWK